MIENIKIETISQLKDSKREWLRCRFSCEIMGTDLSFEFYFYDTAELSIREIESIKAMNFLSSLPIEEIINLYDKMISYILDEGLEKVLSKIRMKNLFNKNKFEMANKRYNKGKISLKVDILPRYNLTKEFVNYDSFLETIKKEIEELQKNKINKIDLENFINKHELKYYYYVSSSNKIELKEKIAKIKILLMHRCMCDFYLSDIETTKHKNFTNEIEKIKNETDERYTKIGGVEYDCYEIIEENKEQIINLYFKNRAKCGPCYM